MPRSPIKILIIDDNPDDRELLIRLFKQDTKGKFQIFESQSGDEGFKVCRNEPPDCLLLDYRLPDLDGLEFLSKLSQIKGMAPIPVIMLTGQGSESIAVEAMKLGVQDYLVKDKINYDALNRVIHTSIEKVELLNKIEKQHTQLETFQKRMLEELEQAQVAQLALLPQKLPDISNVKMATKFVPMDQVGGDFYDLYELKEGRIGIAIADVTGHGVPAALISSMTAGLFKTYAPLIDSPVSLLKMINDALLKRLPEGKYTTACYGIYDPQSRILTYSSAGHPYTYVLRTQTRKVFSLKATGVMLGVFPSKRQDLTEEQFELIPGDKVFFYTDGIIEIINKEEGMFGFKRFESVLLDHAQLSIKDLLETIYSSALDFSNKSSFDDDITLVGIEIL